jgi:hypothetical protein
MFVNACREDVVLVKYRRTLKPLILECKSPHDAAN